MGIKKYIEVEGKPVVALDLREWGRWFGTANRRVALTKTKDGTVSTVFLGLDHNFFGKGPPVLYETLVMRGTHDEEITRYTTREKALTGHTKIVRTLGGEDDDTRTKSGDAKAA